MAITIKNVTDEDRKNIKGLPKVQEHKIQFPKRAPGSAAEVRDAFRDWQKKQAAPEPAKNPDVKIVAVPPTPANIAKIAAIAESDAAPEEIVNQKLDEETLFGTLFAASAIHDYMRMEGEYKKRKAAKATAATADREWAKVVEGARNAFAMAGLKVTDAQLSKWSADLAGNKHNLEAITKIANSRAADNTKTAAARSIAEVDPVALTGSFVTVTAVFLDPNIGRIAIPNLCSLPFAQGTFTQFWQHSWNLTVSYQYWCPIWSNPTRMCWGTVTLAGVSVNLGLNVGYSVTCCGASVWGQGNAAACGTIVGITKCVGCNANVSGVAAFNRVAVSSSQCNYQVGINVGISCNVFGANVFNATWSFAHSWIGPCPLPGIC